MKGDFVLIDNLRKTMLLCGVDCVIARDLFGDSAADGLGFCVLTDSQFIESGSSVSGVSISWPNDLDDPSWNNLLENIVDTLGIGTGVIVFEDNLPAGLLMLWQQAAPMALFKRADEILALVSQQ